MSKWIRFEDAGSSASGKTQRWVVRACERGAVLGFVSWYAAWRKYTFAPATASIFEEDCLRDIAQFCESKTAEHKGQKRTGVLL